MNQDVIVERFFQALICGDRHTARDIVREVISQNYTYEDLTYELYWPALEMISTLYRSDQLTTLAHHYATRLLRSFIDQAQVHYVQGARQNRKIVVFTGAGEHDELSGLVVSDLAEAGGFEVYFAGGGIASDEILNEIGNQRPDILLMFASASSDAPIIRQMIDTIRTIGACPNMQIMVGGGVFGRAPGLAEEIGADMWADTPAELLHRLTKPATHRAPSEQRTVGRSRRPLRKVA